MGESNMFSVRFGIYDMRKMPVIVCIFSKIQKMHTITPVYPGIWKTKNSLEAAADAVQ